MGRVRPLGRPQICSPMPPKPALRRHSEDHQPSGRQNSASGGDTSDVIIGERMCAALPKGAATRNRTRQSMSDTAANFPVIREAVASFADRPHFQQSINELLAAGFEASDISVLASHQPLSAAEQSESELLPAGLSGEIKYIGPLTVAGIILLSGGPI